MQTRGSMGATIRAVGPLVDEYDLLVQRFAVNPKWGKVGCVQGCVRATDGRVNAAAAGGTEW